MRSCGELELQPYALGLCGQVLLHAGGAIFSRKHTLIQFTGLLNKTSRVTVGVRLRESYDFAHLISKGKIRGENRNANIMPARGGRLHTVLDVARVNGRPVGWVERSETQPTYRAAIDWA